jgi:hypothetical protein
MSSVVAVDWDSLTIGTEVGVVADCTLVTIANNIAAISLVLAERPITVDAIVNLRASRRLGNRLVDWHKTMTGVDMFCTLNARRAEVPVGANQTLVADADNVL